MKSIKKSSLIFFKKLNIQKYQVYAIIIHVK